jgi:hypothetical protein
LPGGRLAQSSAVGESDWRQLTSLPPWARGW